MPIKKILLVCLTIFFVSQTNFAQSTENEDVKNYKSALESLVLLKNNNNLIPLQHLDTLKIAYIGLGLYEYEVDAIEQTLKKYTQIESLQVPRNSFETDPDAWLAQIKSEYDLFILGINDLSGGATPAFISYAWVLEGLLGQETTIALVLGGKRSLEFVPNLAKAEGLIFSQQQNEWSQSLAAQAVFGGVGVSGKLNEDFDADFKTGFGLTTEQTRLGYAPPALLGFDTDQLQKGIRTVVQQGLDSMAYPGAQVLVAKDGKVVYHETFGHHTYDKKLPVQRDDIYDFASITKISTGLPAIMKLYGEGKFDLDATLGEYYPPFKNSNKADLTFKRMLTHSSRLMAWIPFWRGTLKGNAKYPWRRRWNALMNNIGEYKSRTFSPDSSKKYNVRVTEDLYLHRRYKKQILKSIKKSPLNEKPGYVYSDLHYYLYPEILPLITQQEFESYLKKNFYRPLGAYTLTYNPYRHFPMDRIIPTEQDTFFRRSLLQGTVHDEGAAMLSGISGHAGLFGSAGDLAKLMQMYLNGGTYGGERFIKKEVLEEFTGCPYCDEGIHRGIGFDKPLIEYDPVRSSIAKDASPESFGHSGYTGTFTWADPKYNLLYIFFCNRVNPTRDNRQIYIQNIRPRVHQAIYDALKKDK